MKRRTPSRPRRLPAPEPVPPERRLCDIAPFPELRAITRHFKEETEGVFAVKNMSEKIFEEGWEKGRQEGRQEGRREMIRDNVVRMLGLGMSLDIIAQSLALPLPEVRALADQLRGA